MTGTVSTLPRQGVDVPEDLRKLSEAASPGRAYQAGLPWFQTGCGVLVGSPDPHAGYMTADTEGWEGQREEYLANDPAVQIASADEDAAFIVGCWNFVRALLARSDAAPDAVGEDELAVDVQRMDTSRGPDFFVRIRCGERSVTPHVFRERWKAEYEVAHFQWVFGLRNDEPDLLSYDETTHPNEMPAALARAETSQGGQDNG